MSRHLTGATATSLLIGLAVLAGGFTAASGASTSTAAPDPSAAGAAGATVSPGAAAGPGTSGSPGPATSASPSATLAGRHADPDLEALLPTSLGGVTLIVESQAGTDLSTDSAAFDAFLAKFGRTRADFSLASAYSPGGLKAQVGAWRLRGADPARLLDAFAAAVQASSSTPLTRVEETVGGRTVTRIGDPGQLTQGPIYVFVRGDTLLFVETTEPALAAEAIGKLPE
jgi:hypothetical protein